MNLYILIQTALREVTAHKFRSFLSMLGVVLGVGSLVATMALTAGIANGARTMLAQFGGIEFIRVHAKEPSLKNSEIANFSPGRTLADVDIIRSTIPQISHVSPEIEHWIAANYATNTEYYPASGVYPDYRVIWKHELQAGRYICDLDIALASRVVVIGASCLETLLPGRTAEQALGQVITLNDAPFTIVGVFELYETDAEKERRRRESSKNANVRPDQKNADRRGRWEPMWWKNRTVNIPLTTMFYEFKSGEFFEDSLETFKLSNLSLRVGDLSRFDNTVDALRAALNITHRGVDDVHLETREEWFDAIERSITSTRMSGGLIALIALVVGGIGITNIMLASITERIREIGIRLAVGARGSDIFLQVLVESTIISFLGGMLGMAAGVGLVHLIGIVAPQDNPPSIEPLSFIISVSFALLAGIISGLYPAMKAARLDPITALRYE